MLDKDQEMAKCKCTSCGARNILTVFAWIKWKDITEDYKCINCGKRGVLIRDKYANFS